MFYPLGKHDLKETITAEIISFLVFFWCLYQFFVEFHSTGYPYVESLPWIGSDFKQLAGVVLFNYAYSITIPSWLNEKKEAVGVNTTIWGSSFIATATYISFGIIGAVSFNKPGDDILVTLASNKTMATTQFAAASFAIAMIGTGVPIFCVIVKNSLYQSNIVDEDWSQFLGSLLPYLISWYFYQGKALLTMVNWTGLLVSGIVAFILPLILALVAYWKITAARTDGIQGPIAIEMSPLSGKNSPSTSAVGKYQYKSIGGNVEEGIADNRLADNSIPRSTYSGSNSTTNEDSWESETETTPVNPLFSDCCAPCRVWILQFGIVFFTGIILSTLVLNIEYGF